MYPKLHWPTNTFFHREKSIFLRPLILLAMAILLIGCGDDKELPVYPDIRDTIGPAELIAFADVGPVFGEELVGAGGRYVIAEGSNEVVQRWYDRLVAEQTIKFVSENNVNETLHTLYRMDGSHFEIVVKPLDSSSSILVIYNSIIRRNDSPSNGNWFRRAWGSFLGNQDKPLDDVVFDIIMGALHPVRTLYEYIWLRPILNTFIALRWVFSWNYVFIIILFTLLIRLANKFIHSYLMRFLLNPLGAVSIPIRIILFFVASFMVILAIWESLNGFYAVVTSSGRSWLQYYTYGFWSHNVKSLAILPPNETFLWMKLDRPSVFWVPIFVMMAGIFIYLAGLLTKYLLVDMITEEDTSKYSESAALVTRTTKRELEEVKEDPVSIIGGEARKQFLKGTIMAFVPLGVSLYFLFDKTIDAIEHGLIAWQTLQIKENQTKNPEDRSYKAERIRLLLRVGVVVVVLGSIIISNKGAFFSFDANNRIVGLFKNPASVSISVTSTPTSTPLVATATATIKPTNTPIPTPTSTPLPTATTTPSPILAIVIADSLNMRSGPSTKFSVLTVLPNGLEVQVIARNEFGDWLSVSYEGETGWVAADYLQIERDITDIPIASDP